MSTCTFTYSHFRDMYQLALAEGYQVVTVADWFAGRFNPERKVLINRVDVDAHIERVRTMGRIFVSLGIKASFYFRLHTKQYNLLFFDNMNLVRSLAAAGNEIGLHAEVQDIRYFCGIDPAQALRAEIALFEGLLDCRIVGVSSHGDMTPNNNLDFWKTHSPDQFGLQYEAYASHLFDHCRYVSDSARTCWKAYDDGQLRAGDSRCACEHIREGVSPIYLLSHSCYHYWHYIYETLPPFEIDAEIRS